MPDAATVVHKTNSISGKINELFQAAIDAADHLPGFLQGGVQELIEKVRDLFHELVRELSKYTQWPGDANELSAAAQRLSNEVQATVSGRASFFNTDARGSNLLGADDLWKGAAADAYRTALKPQYEALAAYAATVKAVSQELDKCAAALKTFWTAVASALISLEIAIIGAITKNIAGLAIAAVAIYNAFREISEASSGPRETMKEAASVFRGEGNDNTPFPPRPGTPKNVGAWPRPNNLENGTVRN